MTNNPKGAGRKPLPKGLKKVMVRFFIEERQITKHGGIKKATNKCIEVLS